MSLICDNKEEHCHVGFEHFNQERAVQYYAEQHKLENMTQLREYSTKQINNIISPLLRE